MNSEKHNRKPSLQESTLVAHDDDQVYGKTVESIRNKLQITSIKEISESSKARIANADWCRTKFQQAQASVPEIISNEDCRHVLTDYQNCLERNPSLLFRDIMSCVIYDRQQQLVTDFKVRVRQYTPQTQKAKGNNLYAYLDHSTDYQDNDGLLKTLNNLCYNYLFYPSGEHVANQLYAHHLYVEGSDLDIEELIPEQFLLMKTWALNRFNLYWDNLDQTSLSPKDIQAIFANICCQTSLALLNAPPESSSTLNKVIRKFAGRKNPFFSPKIDQEHAVQGFHKELGQEWRSIGNVWLSFDTYDKDLRDN